MEGLMNWKAMFKNYENFLRSLPEEGTVDVKDIKKNYKDIINTELAEFDILDDGLKCPKCGKVLETPLYLHWNPLKEEKEDQTKDYNLIGSYYAQCQHCHFNRVEIPYIEKRQEFIRNCIKELDTDIYIYLKQKVHKTYETDIV